jgi:hypothetical protein
VRLEEKFNNTIKDNRNHSGHCKPPVDSPETEALFIHRRVASKARAKDFRRARPCAFLSERALPI